ncbi:MAG: TolC family protein [Bacteroidota bacterium]
MTIKPFQILLFLFVTIPGFAQPLLTLEEAIDITLENNLGIQIARNDVTITENAATKGNAGLLPDITLSGGANYNLASGKASFTDAFPRPDLTYSFEPSNDISAAITASYTIFDGWARVTNFEKLKANKDLSEAQLKQTIENTIIQVINAYYFAAQLREGYDINQELVAISNDRLNRAETRFEFAAVNKLAVLNAEVDLNSDSVSLVRAELDLSNAKRDLNLLMNRSVETEFLIDKGVDFLPEMEVDDLRQKALDNNQQVVLAQRSLALAELDLKSSKAGNYPLIGTSISYRGFTSQNKAQGTQRNSSGTLTGGLTLSYNIFDGKRRKIQRQNAEVAINSSQLQLQQTKESLSRDVENAFASYENSLYVLRIEESNIKSAELNFERSQEALNVGQINSTQFREAQFNLANARTRIANARYQAKLAEMELLWLSGTLVE